MESNVSFINKSLLFAKWVSTTFLLPASVPLVAYKLYNFIKSRKSLESLSGKVVLITGASSGLGEAMAHTFYMAGCKVILAARRLEELERVKRNLLEMHQTNLTQPIVVSLDVTDYKSLEKKVKDVLAIHGQIDILINNSGIGVRSNVIDTNIDVDIKIMSVNYFGTVALTKLILPSMIARKSGNIVFVSSVQGKFSIPERSAYSASKHAMQAFSDAIRAELHDDNIKVLIVSPGYIRTEMSINALTGSGDKYGKMDITTATGANPYTVSKEIMNAIIENKHDIIMATPIVHIAYWLRHFCPSIYFWIMQMRARKLKANNNKESTH